MKKAFVRTKNECRYRQTHKKWEVHLG